jgi:hypothetical protein
MTIIGRERSASFEGLIISAHVDNAATMLPAIINLRLLMRRSQCTHAPALTLS